LKFFSNKSHYNALVRRRIKFVVEKGAMARLFRKGTNAELQEALFQHLKPSEIAKIKTQNEYDNWFNLTVELDCWRHYSKNGLDIDRWAYFAKLINIVVYEIVSNRELFAEADWKRIRSFLHIPIDSTVMSYLTKMDPKFSRISVLKGMTKDEYWRAQEEVRKLAGANEVPPIWFEAAWSE